MPQTALVSQTVGAPWTPACVIAVRKASEAMKAWACWPVAKSCHAVTSFGLSTD